MLLNESQVAIDELLTTCEESVEHYADAAGQVDAPALRELFEHASAQRRDDVERLSQAVRDAGRLPRAPYADRRDLHQLVTHARTALAQDETRVLLDDRIADERQVKNLVDAALQLQPGENERACAQRIGMHAEEVLSRLLAAVQQRPEA